MASSRAKPPHGSRPNRADPLAGGLGATWLLAEKGGLPREALSGTAAATSGGSTTETWGSSPVGSALVFVSTDAQLSFAGAGRSAATPLCTLFAVVRPDGTQGRWVSTSSADSGLALGLQGGNLNVIQNGLNYGNSGPALTAGTWYAVVGVRESAANVVRYYARDFSTGALATVTTTVSANEGAGNGSAALYLRGDSAAFGLALAGYSTRAWSDRAAREWVADPFRMFRRQRLPVPLKAATTAPQGWYTSDPQPPRRAEMIAY